MSEPRAPRVFWTHRGSLRWAVEHVPHPYGTQAAAEWLRDFWRDQADRGFRRAMQIQVIAIVLSLTSVILRVIFP